MSQENSANKHRRSTRSQNPGPNIEDPRLEKPWLMDRQELFEILWAKVRFFFFKSQIIKCQKLGFLLQIREFF